MQLVLLSVDFLTNASTVLGARNLTNSPFASPMPSIINVTGIREMLSVVPSASTLIVREILINGSVNSSVIQNVQR